MNEPNSMIQTSRSRHALVANSVVREIRETHEAVTQSARSGLRSAIRCGELLAATKKAIPHGQWSSWLREHVSISDRTARIYMRAFRYRDQLANISGSVDSISLAMKHLSDYRAKRQRSAVLQYLSSPPAPSPAGYRIALVELAVDDPCILQVWPTPQPGYSYLAIIIGGVVEWTIRGLKDDDVDEFLQEQLQNAGVPAEIEIQWKLAEQAAIPLDLLIMSE